MRGRVCVCVRGRPGPSGWVSAVSSWWLVRLSPPNLFIYAANLQRACCPSVMHASQRPDPMHHIPTTMSARPSSSSTNHHAIAPTVPAPVHAMAAPTPALIDSQLPNYLLPCVLDLLRSSSSHVVQRKRRQEDELRAEGLLPPLDKGKARATAEDEERRLVEEETAKRVERIGLMVGGYVAEK